MVKLDKIYTRGGDGGLTSLVDGRRLAKHDLRVSAYGTVDEANAVFGLVRLHTHDLPTADAMLERIQHDLFDLGADLATPGTVFDGSDKALRIQPVQVTRLEREIDEMNASLSPLTSFILPGGSAASAHLHLARTVVRRAERLATQTLQEAADGDGINPLAVQYLNRLSDHAFVMARFLNDGGKADLLWTPGKNR